MLEDSKMDKKTNNRSSQPQSRAPAVDCKKTELTQRPWPRSNKKREGPGNASKNEPYRKNVPAQRGRGQVDRRPRPRGPSGYAMGGMEISGIADDEPELGSVFVPGSKKQNLNHLLNFMYTPRGAQAPERAGLTPRRPNQQRAFVPHNNELYLHACCQFVVKEDGDYKGNLLDPDVPVKWELIEEIVVRSTGKSECPICLGSPAAGRVARCGHVHCWPCALHYSAAHDRQPPPCPVCAAPFKVELMKPARMLQWEQPADEVTMRLVRRPRGSTVVEAAPARGVIQDASAEILPVGCISDAPYSKLFVASKQQVHEILLRERKELQDQILAEIDTTEIVYMEQALQMLKRQEEGLNQEVAKPNIEIQEEEVPIVFERQVTNLNLKKIDWFDVNEDEQGAQCIEKVEQQLEDLAIGFDIPLNPEAPEFELNNNAPEEFPLLEATPPDEVVTINDIDKENQAKYFYFYQAEDGQQVFLNSLNVRILNASWGALAAAPAIIKGRVLQRETFSLSDQTRKHMPFTAHLPLHCPFDIVELELQPPFVTASALQGYSDDLDRRARARARSEREERRRERAARRAIEGPPKPDFSSELLFPPTSPPNYTPPFVVEESPPLPPPSSGSGLSFAKITGTGGGGAWRVRPSPAPRAPSPPPADGAPRALYLSDAIEAALAAPHSGKKKRGKQKVLFSMGMQHSG